MIKGGGIGIYKGRGEKDKGDFKDEVILKAYEVLIEKTIRRML